MSPNDAAAIAIQLFRLDARLCDQHPMKVARTTNNPSVSGNIIHEATTSFACSSDTGDSQFSSNGTSFPSITVLPISISELHPPITEERLIQCTKDYPDIDLSKLRTELMAKENDSSSIIPVEPVTQQHENASTEMSKEDTLKSTEDHTKTCEKNSTTNNPISNNIIDLLDVSSLSIPDCIMHDLQDMNLALMETVKKPLKHIAFFQTGNFFSSILVIYKYLVYAYLH